jgi:hypothetical protein
MERNNYHLTCDNIMWKTDTVNVDQFGALGEPRVVLVHVSK